MKTFRWLGLFLAPALLLGSAQASAAGQESNRIEKAAAPIGTLAMDGSRVAYESGGKIHVWNTATGATAVVTGKYRAAAQVAIAGTRVAWIDRKWIGNTEASEKLYAAPLGGKARLVASAYRYGRDELSHTTGAWIAGIVGAGKALTVSTWRTDRGVPSAEDLSVVTSTGLRPIASGPTAFVAESASGSQVAVLRSTVAWPSDSQMPIGPAPTVDIYSTGGAFVSQIPLTPPNADSTGIQIALSGTRLVALRTALHEPSGPTTVTLEVYDSATGELQHSWPVGIDRYAGETSLSVYGHLAAVEGPYRLHLVDLDTGKDVAIAFSSHTDSPPALGPRGLVYALDPHYSGPGKLVYVPTARLLQLTSS